MNKDHSYGDILADKVAEATRRSSVALLLSMGVNGHKFATSSTSQAGEVFCALVAWDGADAQVDYTVTQLDGTTITHSNVTLTNGGMPVYGHITGLNVDSGTVCAYYGLNYV